MTLVDRKQVMEHLTKEYNRRFFQGERDGLKLAWIEKAVNDTPAADGVKVIRCRDCRFYSKDTLHCDMNEGKWFVSDYCSYAEKREHETD